MLYHLKWTLIEIFQFDVVQLHQHFHSSHLIIWATHVIMFCHNFMSSSNQELGISLLYFFMMFLQVNSFSDASNKCIACDICFRWSLFLLSIWVQCNSISLICLPSIIRWCKFLIKFWIECRFHFVYSSYNLEFQHPISKLSCCLLSLLKVLNCCARFIFWHYSRISA